MQHRNSIECDRLETKKPSEKSKKKGAEPEVVLYRRRIKMADTQPTNVQPTIENRDLEHATHLRFMRNGDINFGGRSVTWNKKRIRTFDKFLDELTNSVKLRNGAVFRVYTPHHGHRVTNFDKLEEGGLYVAAGQEAFKPLGYTEIDPNPRKRNNKKTTDYYVEPVTHSKLRCSGKIKYNKSEGKIIKVWPNGDKVNPPRIILLSSYMQNDIDDIFRAVGERVSSLLAGSVTRLFALDGTRIKYPDQIHHGGQYVACINQEKLKRVAYKDHGAKGIMTTPRLDSKFLPPLSRSTNKSTKSSKFSTPDHSNPTSSYASEKSSKSNYTTKYKSRQQTKKEDDGVFHAKPVAHKRGSQDKVKKVDYDKDEGGVFKAKGKNQSTSGAQEVEETADTRTELPIDQREAETIEEEERVGAVKVPSGLELTKPPSIQSSQKTELVEESNEKSEEIDNEEDEGRNRSKNNNSKTPRNNLPSQRQQKANSKSRSSNHSNQGQTTPREEVEDRSDE